jgi:hypothetical protein
VIGQCQWFALCDHAAVGTVTHPVLGDVPTCRRCADKFGLELVPRPTWGPREGASGPVHATQDEPHEALSWCGSRRQFRHSIVQGREPDCKKCLRRLALGRPLAYGAKS